MKTIKRNDELRRVSDKEAQLLVKNGWEYCPKNLWKEMMDRKPVQVEVEKEGDNLSDKKKRKLRRENKRKKHDVNR